MSTALSSIPIGTAHAPEKWLACQLLSAAEAQGVRKLNVYPTPSASYDGRDTGNGGNEGLLLWIFAPSLTIAFAASKSASTSNSIDQEGPMHVAKILYKPTTTLTSSHDQREHVSGMMNSAALTEAEFELDRAEFMALRESLESSEHLLTSGAREFAGGWRVGVLRRC